MTNRILGRKAFSLSLTHFKNFVPEFLNHSVNGAQFEHLLINPGPFDVQLLRVCFDDFSFDFGAYNRAVYARGKMPTDTVTLGFAVPAQSGNLLNGGKLKRRHSPANLQWVKDML